MNKTIKERLGLILFICCTVNARASFAQTTITDFHDHIDRYQPYVQIDGVSFLHGESTAAVIADLFVPLWQYNFANLVFADLRVNDRSGSPFEGNLHFGYRHLCPNNQTVFGVYGAFDHKKTQSGNYFNRLVLGSEYWINSWFVGGNVYKPIGVAIKSLHNEVISGWNDSEIIVTAEHEKAAPGADAELGFEFKPGLIGYVGGYYFGASGISTVTGPKARLTYDVSLDNGRILGIFDQLGLEIGLQHDQPRGTMSYLKINMRIGWLFESKTQLRGVAKHMLDPIRRDIDVVTGTTMFQTNENIVGITGTKLEAFAKITKGRRVHPAATLEVNEYFTQLSRSNDSTTTILKINNEPEQQQTQPDKDNAQTQSNNEPEQQQTQPDKDNAQTQSNNEPEQQQVQQNNIFEARTSQFNAESVAGEQYCSKNIDLGALGNCLTNVLQNNSTANTDRRNLDSLAYYFSHNPVDSEKLHEQVYSALTKEAQVWLKNKIGNYRIKRMPML